MKSGLPSSSREFPLGMKLGWHRLGVHDGSAAGSTFCSQHSPGCSVHSPEKPNPEHYLHGKAAVGAGYPGSRLSPIVSKAHHGLQQESSAEGLSKNDSWKRWMRHQLFSGGGGCPCQLCQEFIQVLSGKCSCGQGSGLERQLRPAGVAEPFGKGSWYWAGQNPDVLMVPGVSFQCTGEIGDGTSPGRSREIGLGTSQA